MKRGGATRRPSEVSALPASYHPLVSQHHSVSTSSISFRIRRDATPSRNFFVMYTYKRPICISPVMCTYCIPGGKGVPLSGSNSQPLAPNLCRLHPYAPGACNPFGIHAYKKVSANSIVSTSYKKASANSIVSTSYTPEGEGVVSSTSESACLLAAFPACSAILLLLLRAGL